MITPKAEGMDSLSNLQGLWTTTTGDYVEVLGTHLKIGDEVIDGQIQTGAGQDFSFNVLDIEYALSEFNDEMARWTTANGEDMIWKRHITEAEYQVGEREDIDVEVGEGYRGKNQVLENAPTAGGWGGSCTCPDGQVYQVGDKYDYCGSLSCIGGISGHCSRFYGPWSHRMVICGTGHNQVLENTSAAGGYGGTCTCPDGQVYHVGDRYDHCGSLNCIGGTSGHCNSFYGSWSHKLVICGTGVSTDAEKAIGIEVDQENQVYDVEASVGGITEMNPEFSIARFSNILIGAALGSIATFFVVKRKYQSEQLTALLYQEEI